MTIKVSRQIVTTVVDMSTRPRIAAPVNDPDAYPGPITPPGKPFVWPRKPGAGRSQPGERRPNA